MSKLSFALSILVLPFAFHSIRAQEATQVAETKAGTAAVSGRVTLKGEPARGVMIILDGQPPFPSDTHSARTDENGRFRFTGVATGRYSVHAFAPGYASTEDKSHSGLEKSLNIVEGEKVENIDFEIRRGGVIAGRNENWYVKGITAEASTSTPGRAARTAPQADVARNGVTLKAGEKVAGVTVSIADGASGMSGKMVPATEGARLPARLRIHLVPAGAGDADDVLRYAEAFSRSDGAFSLSNIAPGKYWLIARAAPDEEMSDSSPAPIAWDANERSKLHHEAMAAKNEIELHPCGHRKDYVLRFDR